VSGTSSYSVTGVGQGFWVGTQETVRIVTRCCGTGLTVAADVLSVACPRCGYTQPVNWTEQEIREAWARGEQRDGVHWTNLPPNKEYGYCRCRPCMVKRGELMGEAGPRQADVPEAALVGRDEVIEHASGARHKADKLCGECYLELREIIQAKKRSGLPQAKKAEAQASNERIVGPEE
jgi:hypothetical protein